MRRLAPVLPAHSTGMDAPRVSAATSARLAAAARARSRDAHARFAPEQHSAPAGAFPGGPVADVDAASAPGNDAAGRGWTVTTTVDGFQALEQKVKQRNGRLARVGSSLRFELSGRRTVVQLPDGRLVEAVEATVTRPPAQADGWRLLARFEAVDPQLGRDGASSSYLVRGGDHPQPVNARCDHCGTTRHRRRLYLVEDPSTGQRMQLGATCVEPFLGLSLPIADSVFDELAPDDGEGWPAPGSGGRDAYRTEDLLVAALRVSDAGRSWQRAEARTGPGSAKLARDAVDAGLEAPTERERATVAAILAWADETSADDADGEYVRNVKAALRASHPEHGRWVGDRHAGIAASAVVAYRNEQERAARAAGRDAARARVRQEWVGDLGQRLAPRQVEVVGVSAFTSSYGFREQTGYAVRLIDEDGHLLTWMTTSADGDLETGQQLALERATVKDHEEYRGDRVTRIIRAKLRPA